MTTGRRDGRWEGWSRWVSWRVTRYDPARRDWRGAYPYDEWTCGEDIGDTFRDGTLTPGRYLACEDAYVAVVEEAVRESGVAGLRVADIDPLPPPPARLPPLDPADEPREGAWVPAGRVGAAVRAVLRGDGWARLEGEGLDVHCDGDLYLWLISRRDLPGALSLARGAGLFPERSVSSSLYWERLPALGFPGPSELALMRELVAKRAPYLLGSLGDGASLFRLRGQELHDLSHCVCEGVRDRLEAAPSGARRLGNAGRLVGCPLERLYWTVVVCSDAEAAELPDPPACPPPPACPAGSWGSWLLAPRDPAIEWAAYDDGEDGEGDEEDDEGDCDDCGEDPWWSSSDDVGGTFLDGELTPGRYLACEEALARAVGECAAEAGAGALTVREAIPPDPPDPEWTPRRPARAPVPLPPAGARAPEEGEVVGPDRLVATVRAMVRDGGRFRLGGERGFLACVGDGLWAHVACRPRPARALSRAGARGLFAGPSLPGIRRPELEALGFPDPEELKLIRGCLARRAPRLLGEVTDAASLYRLDEAGRIDLEWSVQAGMQELGVDPDLPPNAYRCLPERLHHCMSAFGPWSDG